MKTNVGWTIGVVAVGVLCIRVAGAAVMDVSAPGVSATAAEGTGVMSASNAKGALATATFADQTVRLRSSPPAYSVASFSVGADVAAGAFVGNYAAAGILGLTFDVFAPNGAVAAGQAFVVTTDGRRWVNTNVVVSAGQKVNNRLDFTLLGGWTRNEPAGTDLAAMWVGDLKKVAFIGVEFRQEGYLPQAADVSEFRLYGSGFMTEAAILSRVNQRFGVNVLSLDELSQTLKVKDSDKDGVTDLEDIIAGREFGFVAEITTSGGADGITIRWPCEIGRLYTVLRSRDVTEGFEVLHGAVDLEAKDSEYMEYKDTTANGLGVFLYRVLRK